MDFIGLAALITALSSLYFSWRKRSDDEAAKKDREEHDRRLRTELTILGQHIAGLRADNAAMAMLINQLFNQYQEATGRKPDIDFDMLKNLQTLSYVTGKLGPLDLSSYQEPDQ